MRRSRCRIAVYRRVPNARCREDKCDIRFEIVSLSKHVHKCSTFPPALTIHPVAVDATTFSRAFCQQTDVKRYQPQQASTSRWTPALVQTLDAKRPGECIPTSPRPCPETSSRLQQRHHVATSGRSSKQFGCVEAAYGTAATSTKSHCGQRSEVSRAQQQEEV